MNPVNAAAGQRNAKIEPQHLDRWAIVYVRQSSPQQVQHHRESAEVQANLRKRAADWGWPDERIRILDGDQGTSATTTDGRDELPELHSDKAQRLRADFQAAIHELISSDIFSIEVANTLARAERNGVIPPGDADVQ